MTTLTRTPPREIDLLYSQVGNTHVFTAEGYRGFHIGSADLKTAFDRAVVALGMHVSRLTGVDATYNMECDFKEFVRHIECGGSTDLLLKATMASAASSSFMGRH